MFAGFKINQGVKIYHSDFDDNVYSFEKLHPSKEELKNYFQLLIFNIKGKLNEHDLNQINFSYKIDSIPTGIGQPISVSVIANRNNVLYDYKDYYGNIKTKCFSMTPDGLVSLWLFNLYCNIEGYSISPIKAKMLSILAAYRDVAMLYFNVDPLTADGHNLKFMES